MVAEILDWPRQALTKRGPKLNIGDKASAVFSQENFKPPFSALPMVTEAPSASAITRRHEIPRSGGGSTTREQRCRERCV
jgi:hypothetical protein